MVAYAVHTCLFKIQYKRIGTNYFLEANKMKKFFLTCSAIMMLQTIVAQEIEYNGYKYDTSNFIEKDSTVTFFPIDKEKLKALNPDNDGYVVFTVPNYPDKKERICIGKQIKQELSTYIEIQDTLELDETLRAKREYIEYRLSVIKSLLEKVANIKSFEGKKLKDDGLIVIYKAILRKYGGEEGAKELAKNKVGINSIKAISQFEEQIATEEILLRQTIDISDVASFLKEPVNKESIIVSCFGDKIISKTLDLPYIVNELKLTLHKPFEQYADQKLSKEYSKSAREFEKNVLKIKKRRQQIFFKNPILSDTPVTVRNPKYKGIGYAEWWWLQNMKGYEHDDGLEHVQTTFPVETDYYKSEKYPEYQFYPLEYPIPGRGWYVTDNKKNLIGVQYKGFKADSLEKALLLYDYEHNAYDIKSESQGTQEWILYKLKKRGNHETDALDWAHIGIIFGLGTVLEESQKLRYLYASGRISKVEHDRRMSELKKKAKTVKRAANSLANSMPSAEEQDRAEKYIQQLESDYNHKYNLENVNAERLNGTQMMLYTADTKVKALLTYYLDDDGKLTIAIDIIEKK
jgi:hypothetical protein